MSAATQTHRNNIVIGSGELFIDLLSGDGKTTGERYLGDSPGASLSVAAERVTVMSGDGPVAVRLIDKVRSIERTLSLTLHDISAENLALFVGAAAPADVGASSSRVTDEEHRVRAGRWYQLGASTANPRGVGKLHASSLSDDDDDADKLVVKYGREYGVTAASGTDYRVDIARGRIYIVPGNEAADATLGKAMADNTGAPGTAMLKISYSAAAPARQRVEASARPREVLAALRYIEDADSGAGRDYYAPRCSIGAGGELALKSRDTEQQIALTCSILDPGGGRAALYIDGEAA